MRRLRWQCLVLAAAAMAASAGPGSAQSAFTGATLDVYGGLSTFGRLLEQYVLNGQREVSASNSFLVGGAVGVQPWEEVGIRLGATWAPSQIQFRDDSGLGQTLPGAEMDDVADLTATVVSLEATANPLGGTGRIRPYTIFGVAAGWWSLSDQGATGEVATGGEDRQFGFGGTGGLGVELRPGGPFVVRLEAAQFRLGNPFNGTDGWAIPSGTTFDEPDSVRLSRYTAGIGIALGG